MRTGCISALLLLLAGIALIPAHAALADPTNWVVMQGLNKVTARVSTFEIPVGQSVTFGTLSITLHHCDRTPPEEPPESVAFLEIMENRSGDEPESLFTGWMFASSPALSALEHPVYDVWVLKCVNR